MLCLDHRGAHRYGKDDPLVRAMQEIGIRAERARQRSRRDAMHCRADEIECRGESYCACQCEKCKAAWAAGGPGGTDPEKPAVQP